jgi:sensor histidine kinase regulating citrate/malate metabolism
MRKTLIILTVLVLPVFAQAKDICKEFSDRIEIQIKDAALSWAASVADNSIPRITLQETKIGNSYLKINNFLLIMQMNGCKYAGDLDESIYYVSALECKNQRYLNPEAKCEITKWDRSKDSPK